MNIISVQFTNGQNPKYMQLFEYIKQLISNGELKPGEKLPTIRRLAEELEVNSITVVNAYKQLENHKYITAKKGSGYYISKAKLQKEETSSSSEMGLNTEENTINFASATPHPAIFPIESFKECINFVLERDKGYAFGYQESNGFKPLRISILDYLRSIYSIQVEDEERLLIVSGAQQGIDLIGKVLLNPGDYVITENPTYDGAVAVFKSRGARVVSVNIEEDGIDLIDLEKKIRICKPKLLYLMTSFQNPTSISYSPRKLKAVIGLAEKYNIYIVEDDTMSEITFEDRKIDTLKAFDVENNYVIYLKSFSKILMPGLRAGCLVIPDILIQNFMKIKQTSDISSSGLIQRSLEQYFKTGKWDEHLLYMKEIYRGKYEYMLGQLERLQKYGIRYQKPNGGLYFWIMLPKGISAKSLHQECKKNSLLLIPSDVFYELDNKNQDSYIRLSYAATNIEQIRSGIEMLELLLLRMLQAS